MMLETIHEYAREKLEASGEAEEVRRGYTLSSSFHWQKKPSRS